MFHFKPLVLAAAAALCVTGVASAHTADADALQTVVRYHSAALDSEEGVRHLYSKLLVAAEKVCPQSGLLPSEAVIECRKQAVAGAVEKIHNTRLATLSGASAKRG